MCIKLILEILTSAGTIGAVVVGMYSIHRSNENSKEQILTNKLEELLELMKSLARYYVKLKELHVDVQNYRNPEFTELTTLAQYYTIRDQKLTSNEREFIFDKLFRIEVLTNCYLNGNCKDDFLRFESLIYAMTESISNGGSIQELLDWPNGFPTYEEFYNIVNNLEEQIINKIKSR